MFKDIIRNLLRLDNGSLVLRRGRRHGNKIIERRRRIFFFFLLAKAVLPEENSTRNARTRLIIRKSFFFIIYGIFLLPKFSQPDTAVPKASPEQKGWEPKGSRGRPESPLVIYDTFLHLQSSQPDTVVPKASPEPADAEKSYHSWKVLHQFFQELSSPAPGSRR